MPRSTPPPDTEHVCGICHAPLSLLEWRDASAIKVMGTCENGHAQVVEARGRGARTGPSSLVGRVLKAPPDADADAMASVLLRFLAQHRDGKPVSHAVLVSSLLRARDAILGQVVIDEAFDGAQQCLNLLLAPGSVPRKPSKELSDMLDERVAHLPSAIDRDPTPHDFLLYGMYLALDGFAKRIANDS